MKLLLSLLLVLFTVQAFAADMRQLYAAAGRGDIDALKRWITIGNDINIQDTHGNSAILLASENGHTDAVQLLIQADANLNQFNVQGYTPIHAAIVNGHTDVINALYIAGADLDVRNQFDSTAMDFVRSLGFTSINDYINDLQAKPLSRKTGPNSHLYFKAWEKRRLALIESGQPEVALSVMANAAKFDVDAQYFYGLHLLQTGDKKRGMKMLTGAADGGNADAQYRVGIYMTKSSADPNPVEGFNYIQRSAQNLHPAAIGALGRCYLLGIGTRADYPMAFSYLQRAAVFEDENAKFYLAAMLYYGIGLPKDEREGMNALQALAREGNTEARRQLSRFATEETLNYLASTKNLTMADVRTLMLSANALLVSEEDGCEKYDVSKIFDPDYGIRFVTACFSDGKTGTLILDVAQDIDPIFREFLINYQLRAPVRYNISGR